MKSTLDARSAPLAPASDRLFFNYLLENGPSSRAHIATEHGLSRPTASEAAARLTGRGLIRALDKEAGASGKRGRVPELYELKEDLGCLVTIVASIDAITGTVFNMRREKIFESSVATTWESQEKVLAILDTLVATLQENLSSDILAVTVSVISPVDPNSQQLRVIPGLPYKGTPVDFFSFLTQRLDAPVLVDDHVNWVMLQAIHSGMTAEHSVVLGIHMEKGISLALSIGGRPYRGARGRNGLIHLTSHQGKNLLQQLQEISVIDRVGFIKNRSGYINFEKTVELIMQNPQSLQAHTYFALLGECITNTALVTDPSAILLTGPTLGNQEFARRLSASIRSLYPWDDLEVLISDCGSVAVSQGALEGAHLLAMVSLGLEDPRKIGVLYAERPSTTL